jgi:hypothetical protein
VGVGVIVAVGVRLGVRVAVGEWVMVGVLVCVGMIARVFVGRLEAVAVGCGVRVREVINATGWLQPVMSISPMTIIPWRMQHWREKMEQIEADRDAVR